LQAVRVGIVLLQNVIEFVNLSACLDAKKLPVGAVVFKPNLIPFSVLRAGCNSYFLTRSSLKGSPLSMEVMGPASNSFYFRDGRNAVFLLIFVNFIALASFSSYFSTSLWALLLYLIRAI